MVIVAPRKRRVSRNAFATQALYEKDVAPRKRRVSRNWILRKRRRL